MLWLLPLLLPVIMFPHPDSHNKIDFVHFAFTFIILFVRSIVGAILIIILTNVLENLRYNTGRGWGLEQCIWEKKLATGSIMCFIQRHLHHHCECLYHPPF